MDESKQKSPLIDIAVEIQAFPSTPNSKLILVPRARYCLAPLI